MNELRELSFAYVSIKMFESSMLLLESLDSDGGSLYHGPILSDHSVSLDVLLLGSSLDILFL